MNLPTEGRHPGNPVNSGVTMPVHVVVLLAFTLKDGNLTETGRSSASGCRGSVGQRLAGLLSR